MVVLICISLMILDMLIVKKILFLNFLAIPTACESSWARDRTHTTVVTQATAVTKLDP